MNIRSIANKLLKALPVGGERIDRGVIFLTKNIVSAGGIAIPISNLASITYFEERRNKIIFVIIASIIVLYSLNSFAGILSGKFSSAELIAPLFGMVIVGFLIWLMLRPFNVGVIFQASSGKTIGIVSQDRSFILDVRNKVFEILEGKGEKYYQINIDNRSINTVTHQTLTDNRKLDYKNIDKQKSYFVDGDASFGRSIFNKNIGVKKKPSVSKKGPKRK